MKIQNPTKAPQGVWTRAGALVWVEPGATRDVDTDAAPSLCVVIGADVPAPAGVDAMGDDALRAFITQATGKAPHQRLGRVKLLEAARALQPPPAEDEFTAMTGSDLDAMYELVLGDVPPGGMADDEKRAALRKAG